MKNLQEFVTDAKDMGQLMVVGAALSLAGLAIAYQSALASTTIMGVCSVIFGIVILSTAVAEYRQDKIKIKKIEDLIMQGTPYKKALEEAQPEEFVDFNHEDVNDVT